MPRAGAVKLRNPKPAIGQIPKAVAKSTLNPCVIARTVPNTDPITEKKPLVCHDQAIKPLRLGPSSATAAKPGLLQQTLRRGTEAQRKRMRPSPFPFLRSCREQLQPPGIWQAVGTDYALG